jgi:uncharacterized coiled-coil protein SlyX
MSDPESAEIIPFPPRMVEIAVAASNAALGTVPGPISSSAILLEIKREMQTQSRVQPDNTQPNATGEAQARLARALQALDAAVTEQRAAVAAWRSALSDLSSTMQSLSGSVQRYRGSLLSLDSKVAHLRGEANRLERWADEAIAASSTTAASSST